MPLLRAKDIAIIGAGPCGLAAAKYLIAEKHFSKIDIFEQSSQVGGVWNYTADVTGRSWDGGGFKVPQIEAHVRLERPTWRKRKKRKSGSEELNGNGEVLTDQAASSITSSCSTSSSRSSSSSQTSQIVHRNGRTPTLPSVDLNLGNQFNIRTEPVFPSPMYEELETNIPRTLMRFSDLPFPSDCQLFPRHEAVKTYIDEYGKELLPLVKFETQVQEVKLLEATKDSSTRDTSSDSETIKERWSLQAEELRTGRIYEEKYDAVILANGHYSVPFVPYIEGAKEWNDAFPGTLSHSKTFRTAEEYRDKKVIVIGNSASGLDIGRQISKVCMKPLIVSQHKPSDMGSNTSPQIQEVPPIQSFLPEDGSNSGNERSVLFTNGRLESNVDAVLFCTGYLYSYPMLSNVKPAPITDGARVEHSYEHLIYVPHPSLSFMALPQKVIPFPVSEAQAAVVARLYSGRLNVPSLEVMEKWERETVERKGDIRRKFHILSFPEDGEYINRLLDWAAEADTAAVTRPSDVLHRCGPSADISSTVRTGYSNGDHETIGKTRPKWGKREFWIRERFTDIRKAFLARGEERHGVKTLEELGFRFDDDNDDDGNVSEDADGKGVYSKEAVKL